MFRPPHAARRATGIGVIAALGLAAGAAAGAGAQEPSAQTPASRTEALQIEQIPESAGGKAFIGPERRPPQVPGPTMTEAPGAQISRGAGNAPASQITSRAQGTPGMAQLSRADLDATLAQLSPAERRVLLQAIEGTDICDNPPTVAAILTLCQNRLETRSQEFGAIAESAPSAEEQLMRGDLENAALPTVGQVIERLARGGASSGDFSNQAIASIALATPATTPPRPREEEQPAAQSFAEESQALINALINQLGGRAP
jgi:hypothetical protein